MRALVLAGIVAALQVGCGGSTDSAGTGGSGARDGGAGSGGSAGTSGSGGSGASAGSGGVGGGIDGGAKPCGGLAGAQCAADEYCDFTYSGANLCGGDDGQGICQKKPANCPKDCSGVCGCDGQFYCNTCLAHAGGTDDTADTACLVSEGGKPCGGSGNIPCAADEWCDVPNGCGAPGSMGVCQTRPQGCTADCPGVCGCDGQFYCNVCDANAMGVDTGDSTSCSPGDGGQNTGCSSDFDCQSGLKCCYPCGIPGCSNACIPPDSSGQCPMFA